MELALDVEYGGVCRKLDFDFYYEVISHVYASQSSRQDLSNLMLTCQAIRDIAISFFYRYIRIKTRRQAHKCISTLAKNDLAALSVQTILIQSKHSLYLEDEGEYDKLPLIPLLAEVLLRTPHLRTLAFDNLVNSKDTPSRWSNERKHMFSLSSRYKFTLNTFVMAYYVPDAPKEVWESLFQFLQKQTQLRHVAFYFPLPRHWTQLLNLPRLESVHFKFSLADERNTIALFSRFSQITDAIVTCEFEPRDPTPPLRPVIEGVLKYAHNLTSLAITFFSRKVSDPLPLLGDVQSKTLHYLTILAPWKGSKGSSDLVLLDINSMPHDIMSNLKSILFEYRFPHAFDFSTWLEKVSWCAEMKGTEFYFGMGEEKVLVARRDNEEDGWKTDELKWEEVPRVHVSAINRTQWLMGERPCEGEL